MSAPRVTLAEIAAEAGVSLATMSKVLNGRSDVAAGTRARLEEHLKRHGYTRRPSAQRSESIELVFHELEASWSMEVIEGVEEVAHAAGLSVVLTVSGDRHAP
ncbi:MAG: LacI family transcriptional regulator, partial [Microbacterium sp.]